MYDVNLCKMSRRRSKRLSQNQDKIVCHFCGCDEENEVKYGKLWNQDGIITHYYCLLLSSNMEQNGEDEQGILGFMPADIQKELRRGKKLSCCYCKRSGATLGCCHPRCKRVFHLPCGLQAGSLHQFFGEFRSYCVTHRIQQEIDEHIKQEAAAAEAVICCICYEDVSPNNTIRTLWAPCCRKNAWFHRDCVQRLALSAGYFFKCPLCNNKQEFQQAMLDHGIFIPNQDASWELVPDAFQELLHRHNSCDAVECLCPKGRGHTSVNAKWELVLCRLCGSQGIHKACGNLKWSNSTWDCAQCANMLDKATDESFPENGAIEETRIRMMPEDSDDDSDISVVGDSSPKPTIEDRYSPPPVILSSLIRPGPRSFKLKQAVQNVTSTESATSNTSDTPLLEDRVQSSLTHPEHIADALSNETDNERSSTDNTSGEIDLTDTEPGSVEQNSDYSLANEPSPEKTQTIESSEQLTSEIISLDSDDEVEIINVPQLQNVLTTKNGIKIEIHSLPKLPAEFQKVEGDLNVINSISPQRIPSRHGLISPKKSDSLVNHFKNSTSHPTPNSDETSILRTELSAIRNTDKTAVKLIENPDDSDLIVVDEHISQPLAMNIKITNVTSLCPHVVPDMPLILKKKESISSKPRLLRSDLENESMANDDQPIQLVETAIGELGLKRKDKFFDHSDSVTGPSNDEVGLRNKKARVSQSLKSPSALQNTDDEIHMFNDVGGSIPNNGTYGTSLVPSTSNTKMCDPSKSQKKQHWSPADIKTNKSGVSNTLRNTDKNKEKNKLFRFSSIPPNTIRIQGVRNTNSGNISINGYSPMWPECHANVSKSVSTTLLFHAQGGKRSGLRKILPKPNVNSAAQIDDNVLFNVPQILSETSDKLVHRQQTSEQHTSHQGETVDSSSQPSSRSSEIINGEMSVRNESKQTTQTSMFTSSSRFCCPAPKNVLNTSSSIAQVADGLSITSVCDGGGAGSDRGAEARSGFHGARSIPNDATAESITGQREFGAESQTRHGACHDSSVCVTADSSNIHHFSTSTTRRDCNRPRLIPSSVSLGDLKFRIVESGIVQIAVSDTLTLNVNTSTSDVIEESPAKFTAVKKCDSLNNSRGTKTIDLGKDFLRKPLTDLTAFEHLLDSRTVQGIITTVNNKADSCIGLKSNCGIQKQGSAMRTTNGLTALFSSYGEIQSSPRNPCKKDFYRRKSVSTFGHTVKNSNDLIGDVYKISAVPTVVEELSEIVEQTSVQTVKTNKESHGVCVASSNGTRNCSNNQSKNNFVESSTNIAMKNSQEDENVNDPKPCSVDPRLSIKVKIDLDKIQNLINSKPQLFKKHDCAKRRFENYHEPRSLPVLTPLQKFYNSNENKQINSFETLIDENVKKIDNSNLRKKFKCSKFFRDHLKS